MFTIVLRLYFIHLLYSFNNTNFLIMKKLFTLLIVAMFSLSGLHAQNTCATAVAIPGVPFSSGVKTTCGTGNEYVPGDYFAGNYGGGEDYVYSMAITTAPVAYKFNLGGAATWKIMSVHSACPPTLANALGGITSSSGTGETIINFPTNGIYYIFIDTWPTPDCGEFTLDITLAPTAPNCATLLIPANASTVTGVNPTLSWAAPAAGQAPTAYKVYLGLTNPPTNLPTTINAPLTSYTPTTSLAFSTTYYWYVTPTNGGSDAIGCDATVYSFTTPAPPPPPANDDCAGAVSLTVNPTLVCAAKTSGTTVSATQSTETAPSCAATGINDDVWYKFVATSTSHKITIDNVVGNTTDMAMAVYTGGCGSLTQLVCTDPEELTLVGLTVGAEYKIRVWTYTSTATTRASFDICIITMPPAPANDDCGLAVALIASSTSTCATPVSGTTVSATQSTSVTAPTCSVAGINDDVWYTFVATSARHLVNVVYTDNATVTQVYSGACGTLAAVGCYSGAYGNSNLLLSSLTIGNTYYVRVYSASSIVGSSSEFSICITTPSVPSNDTCATALAIPCGGSITGSNALATDDPLPASTCGSSGTTASYKGVWFTVTATQNGPLTISACSSTFDGYLRVYTGDCATLTCIGNVSGAGFADGGCGGINNAPTVTFNGATGVTYKILLSSYSSTNFGTYTISANCTQLGTTEVAKSDKLTIAPNPFTDFIRISEVKDVVSISIVDLSGRIVKTMKPTKDVNLGDLKSGMYLINLRMKDGSVQTVKSIKR